MHREINVDLVTVPLGRTKCIPLIVLYWGGSPPSSPQVSDFRLEGILGAHQWRVHSQIGFRREKRDVAEVWVDVSAGESRDVRDAAAPLAPIQSTATVVQYCNW